MCISRLASDVANGSAARSSPGDQVSTLLPALKGGEGPETSRMLGSGAEGQPSAHFRGAAAGAGLCVSFAVTFLVGFPGLTGGSAAPRSMCPASRVRLCAVQMPLDGGWTAGGRDQAAGSVSTPQGRPGHRRPSHAVSVPAALLVSDVIGDLLRLWAQRHVCKRPGSGKGLAHVQSFGHILCVCVHTHLHPFTQTYTHSHSCTHTVTCTPPHTHALTHICPHMHAHTHIHSCTHTIIHSYTHSHLHARTHTHTSHLCGSSGGPPRPGVSDATGGRRDSV